MSSRKNQNREGCATRQSSYNGLTIANGIGRRTGMTDQAGSEAWSYDLMGRVASDQRTTNALTNAFSYTYNLDGSVATVIHPTKYALTLTFQPGGAGRPVAASSGDAPYAQNVHYAPNGSLCFRVQGWGQTFSHDYTFNSRFQPVRVYISGVGVTPPAPCTTPTLRADILDLTYSYVDANGHNNGNVAQIANNIGSTSTQSFTYDSLNRIATAQTNGTASNDLAHCWAETYTYDPWGNLYAFGANATTQSAYTGCSQESGLSGTSATNKNQLTAYGYDSAGNVINIPAVASYTYDAENHLLSTAGVTYSYDGDGKRVMKSTGKIYWYGAGSDPVIETDAAGNFQYRYFYFAGMRVAREEFNDWVDHYFNDALGNARIVYGNAGGWDQSDYYPFGGERVLQSAAGNHFKFTGKERDSESGLDNFGARFDSSSLGRFMSPDPMGGHQEDPQTMNRYSYVRNNPLNLTDPTGLDFYLQCNNKDHKDCVQVQTDPKNDKSQQWVQAQDGKATVITSDSIRAGDYAANVNGNGVTINGSRGIYFENEASDAKHSADGKNHNPVDLAGSLELEGFKFHIDGNCNGSCLSAGEWTYNGSLNAARALLDDRGSFRVWGALEDIWAGFGNGKHPFSTQHRFGGPLNSPHLSVAYDPNGTLEPRNNVPSTGGFHVDEHGSWFGLAHASDVINKNP